MNTLKPVPMLTPSARTVPWLSTPLHTTLRLPCLAWHYPMAPLGSLFPLVLGPEGQAVQQQGLPLLVEEHRQLPSQAEVVVVVS